jgi:hypothetical protein
VWSRACCQWHVNYPQRTLVLGYSVVHSIVLATVFNSNSRLLDEVNKYSMSCTSDKYNKFEMFTALKKRHKLQITWWAQFKRSSILVFNDPSFTQSAALCLRFNTGGDYGLPATQINFKVKVSAFHSESNTYNEVARVYFTSSDRRTGMTLGEIAAQEMTSGECEVTRFAFSCIYVLWWIQTPCHCTRLNFYPQPKLVL